MGRAKMRVRAESSESPEQQPPGITQLALAYPCKDAQFIHGMSGQSVRQDLTPLESGERRLPVDVYCPDNANINLGRRDVRSRFGLSLVDPFDQYELDGLGFSACAPPVAGPPLRDVSMRASKTI